MKTRCLRAALCRVLPALLLLSVLRPSVSPAQPTPNPPGQISYQGFLVDANGIALATNAPKNYTITFRIYNVPTGAATPVWGELQTVTVDRGYFSVLLGQGSSVPGAPWTNDLTGLFNASDASDRYIGTTISGLTGGDVEIQPRMRLLSSPYSLLAGNARNAITLNGYDWTTLFPDTGNPATGTFPGAKLAVGSVTATQIAGGAVGSAQLASQAVGTAQIANQAVGNAQLAPGSVDGSILSLPLSISGYAGYSFIFLGGGVPSLVSITNTAVSTSGGGLGLSTHAGYTLKVGGETAIAATSQAGNAAYIGDSSYAGEFTGAGGSYGKIGSTSGDAADFKSGNGSYAGSICTSAIGAYFTGPSCYAYLADSGYGAFFEGNVAISGTLSKSAGSFRIDHPLDPANKYLNHSFVESPDMKNIYDGVATLDSNGEAVVTFPAWFEPLNRDFRYQLTAMGAPEPNLYVAQEVTGNQFKIGGGASGGRASWQVTGIRHDDYANAHRIPVEEDKTAELRGTYLNPEVHGQPFEKNEILARHRKPKPDGAKPANP